MMRCRPLYSGGRTAAYLARLLGEEHNWENVLNDYRKGHPRLRCEPLLPYARQKRGMNCATPLYHPADIVRFVHQVRRRHGCDRPFALPVCEYLVDDSAGTYWFIRTATPVP